MLQNQGRRAFATFHSKIAVVGAGCGGHNFAGQISRHESGAVKPGDITVFDPKQQHHYQPSWTMIGGGVLGDMNQTLRKESTYCTRSQAEMFSKNNPRVNWVPEAVASFQPDQNSLTLANGDVYTYDFLVVNPGLKMRFDMIQGSQEALEDPNAPVSTIYTLSGAYKTSRLRESFRGGKAVFTLSQMPIKCGGAPQKIMYLSEHTFRKNGVRDLSEVHFYASWPNLFAPCAKFAEGLKPIAESKDIRPHFRHVLTAIDKDNKVATFKAGDESVDVQFDFLHFTPPQSAPDFIRTSPLAGSSGFLNVDKFSYQHNQFSNVFGLGDVCDTPVAKTAAAIFKQTPIVVHNMLREMGVKKEQASYDGYSSCPIFVGDGKLMLAEFKYDGVPSESFFKDQTKPRRSFYYMKKEVFPRVYFNLMPKGSWFGRDIVNPVRNLA